MANCPGMCDLPVKKSRIHTKRKKDGQVTYQVATIETYMRDPVRSGQHETTRPISG